MLRWRKEIAKKPKRLVIKLGSQCVTDELGGVSFKKVNRIAKDVLELKKQGLEVILVCSGAIQAARAILKTKKTDISSLQALSAVGQNRILNAFEKKIAKAGYHLGQILLTHEDFKSPSRYFNLKNTIENLLSWKCIPIINENDSISFDEITVGDNDQLAAMISENLSADLLLILSETDGLYTKNPKDAGAEKIHRVSYDENFEKIQTINKSISGRGGMKTKLDAVRKLTPLGVPVIISGFDKKEAILSALSSENTGSFFDSAKLKLNKRKSRILNQARSQCLVKIDSGALQAIENNKSLLPVGILKTEGNFKRGDVINIMNRNKVIASGIVEFGSKELKKYLSLDKPQDFQEILNIPSKVFIHKNNLIKKEH